MIGPSATGAFCSASRAGSALYSAVLAQPWVGAVIGVILILLVAAAGAATQWSPRVTSPLRTRRRFGQVVRVTTTLYRRHPALMVGLGLPFIVLPLLLVLEYQVLPWLVVTLG